jgi:tetratricopeptide (TPR) repeat protein
MRTTTITCAALTVLVLAGCDGDSAPAANAAAQQQQAPAKETASAKIEASLVAAQEYVQSGDMVRAEAILRTLIDRAPDESRGHEMLGQTLMQRAMDAERGGDAAAAGELRKQAYANYREAVRLDPDSAGLQHSAGMMAMAAGESDAALAHFHKAEELEPSNPQFPLFAAQVLMQQKRLDEAEAALQRVLAIDADEPYAHASLAMLALEREQFERALQEIALARQALPDDVGLRAQQAKVHRRMNQPRQALELLIGLEGQERAQEAVTFEIAAAYDMLAEPERAAAAWALCFQTNPRGPRAFYAAVQAARMHLKARGFDEAIRWANVAEQLAPESTEVTDIVQEIRAVRADS